MEEVLRKVVACQRVNRLDCRLGVLNVIAFIFVVIAGVVLDELLSSLVDVELSSFEVELLEVDLNGLSILRDKGESSDARAGKNRISTARVVEGFRH